MLGEKASESRRSAPGGYAPAREYSMRREFDSRVTVPTEDREPGVERRCSSDTAGGSPVTESTFGAPIWWISLRA
ncbi:hypothetical protein GCM10020254_16260 [Streptomyces goshikiensis]